MSEQILAALRSGDFSAALKLANALVEASPDYSDPHYLQALALQSSGLAQQALAAIDRAIALAPDRSDYAMTKALMQIGGFEPQPSGSVCGLVAHRAGPEKYG